MDAARQSTTTSRVSSEQSEDLVQRPPIGKVDEPGIGVKALERGVLVVGVTRDEGELFILEVLDEVRGEEAFADHAGSGMIGTMPGTGLCRVA